MGMRVWVQLGILRDILWMFFKCIKLCDFEDQKHFKKKKKKKENLDLKGAIEEDVGCFLVYLF